jgi:hypothetical protein
MSPVAPRLSGNKDDLAFRDIRADTRATVKRERAV